MMRFLMFLLCLVLVQTTYAGLLSAIHAGLAAVANPSHRNYNNSPPNPPDNGNYNRDSGYGHREQTQPHSFLGRIASGVEGAVAGQEEYTLGQQEARVLGGFNPYGYHPWGAGPSMGPQVLYNDDVTSPGAVSTGGVGYYHPSPRDYDAQGRYPER